MDIIDDELIEKVRLEIFSSHDCPHVIAQELSIKHLLFDDPDSCCWNEGWVGSCNDCRENAFKTFLAKVNANRKTT